MLSRERFLESVLLLTIYFLKTCLTQPYCIQYETYQVTYYELAPFSSFFQHKPVKRSRIGIRSKRCFQLDPGRQFFLGERTTEKFIRTPPAATTSEKQPCNGSCATNEECSVSEDICSCKTGFQRSGQNTSAVCVPKCEPECQHADCTAPNTCTCWPHYERRNDSFCQLPCSELSCAYGECDENGTCVCAQGFLNNGTLCVWAGDAILSEPDDCNCWSKFVWQKNRTQSDQKCLPLCKESVLTAECIDAKLCQCYEGFLVCHDQILKCLTMGQPSSTVSYQADREVEEKESSAKLTLLIVAFLSIIAVLGGFLWLWEKRRGPTYNQMERLNREDGQTL